MRGEAAHQGKVAWVVRQLQAHDPGRPVSLRKRTPSHQVPKRRDRKYSDDKIDLTDLDALLEIDRQAMTCTAEPGLIFSALVDATLPLGLVPRVVPEFRGITIGGAVSGCSLESMSFRHGGFHDTCLEYEVVTARGEVLRCTPDNEHQLLFQMMHGSFGTVGVLTRLKFRLTPAKAFVHLTYEKHRTLDGYQQAIWRRFRARDVDFMDGIIHSPNEYVLSLGTFVDQAPYIHRYDWVKVYYRSTARRREDYLPTKDYFFRYDSGVTSPFPRTALARLLFGRFLRSSQTLWLAEKLHRLLPEKRPRVTLDVFIPFSRTGDFLAWNQREIGHYPIWCVPYHRVRDYEWLSPRFWAPIEDELFLDLAFYGLEQPEGRNYYRMFEEELSRVNGVKTLISHNYYARDEFWRIWNEPNYREVKRRTDPDNIFRDLYAKTCLATRGLEASPS